MNEKANPNNMKRLLIFSILTLVIVLLISAVFLKDKQGLTIERTVDPAVKAYWFDGQAELSSYKLTQARYGEIHEGTAVLIYVTEPFSKLANTKADKESSSNIPVLKLNTDKKFLTGIYPYSMMNSTFFPLENGNSSLKMATSIQEWCGMSYLEMKHKDQFIFNLHSYFEGQSFSDKKVDKIMLEDDLWSLIRLNPELLPTGAHQMLPSMFYTLLMHHDIKPVTANIRLYDGAAGVKHYEINYPALARSITIMFNATFPNSIVGWEERYESGYGSNKKMLTTKATLIKTIKTDYWNKHSVQDSVWRDTLGL